MRKGLKDLTASRSQSIQYSIRLFTQIYISQSSSLLSSSSSSIFTIYNSYSSYNPSCCTYNDPYNSQSTAVLSLAHLNRPYMIYHIIQLATYKPPTLYPLTPQPYRFRLFPSLQPACDYPMAIRKPPSPEDTLRVDIAKGNPQDLLASKPNQSRYDSLLQPCSPNNPFDSLLQPYP